MVVLLLLSVIHVCWVCNIPCANVCDVVMNTATGPAIYTLVRVFSDSRRRIL